MEIFRKTGLCDYIIFEGLQKFDFNIFFICYLLGKPNQIIRAKKNSFYYIALCFFHFAIFLDRKNPSSFVYLIDSLCSFCLFIILKRDLVK
jgi:hypothetical protein